MNREASLSKRVLTSKGLRYCPVVTSKNGRIKPDTVIVDGQEEQHPEGAYYISWYVGRKLMRLSVGKDAADASARRLSKEADLRGSCESNDDSNDARPTLNKIRIVDAIDEYLSETKMTRTSATHSAYELALRNFTDSCSKTLLHEITRADLLGYIKHLRDQKLSDRTCHNRFEHLMTFLHASSRRARLERARPGSRLYNCAAAQRNMQKYTLIEFRCTAARPRWPRRISS